MTSTSSLAAQNERRRSYRVFGVFPSGLHPGPDQAGSAADSAVEETGSTVSLSLFPADQGGFGCLQTGSAVKIENSIAEKEDARMKVWPGQPYPLGAVYDGSGTNFSLFSEFADKVKLSLFAADNSESHFDAAAKSKYSQVATGVDPCQQENQVVITSET